MQSSHYASVIYFYNLNVNDKDDKQILKSSQSIGMQQSNARESESSVWF